MSLDISIFIALMAMLGGVGSLWGPIMEAAIMIPMKSYLKELLGARSGLVGINLIIYASVIMLISACEPRGIWGISGAGEAEGWGMTHAGGPIYKTIRGACRK